MHAACLVLQRGLDGDPQAALSDVRRGESARARRGFEGDARRARGRRPPSPEPRTMHVDIAKVEVRIRKWKIEEVWVCSMRSIQFFLKRPAAVASSGDRLGRGADRVQSAQLHVV